MRDHRCNDALANSVLGSGPGQAVTRLVEKGALEKLGAAFVGASAYAPSKPGDEGILS